MSKTRKDLLIEKYSVLETKLKPYLSNELFPSLETVDVADLTYYITMIFLGITTHEQFDDKLKELMDTNGVVVSSENYENVLPLVEEFILWFRKH